MSLVLRRAGSTPWGRCASEGGFWQCVPVTVKVKLFASFPIRVS
jgi:hypothetical protein